MSSDRLHRTSGLPGARAVVDSMALAGLFALSVYAGRATVLDGTSVSLVWPAAGVAAAWFLLQHGRRTLPLDLSLLVGATVVINHLTGAPVTLSAWFVVANLLQLGVFVALFTRSCPDLWGAGGSTPFSLPRHLGRLGLSAAAAAAAGAAVGPTGVWLVTGHWSALDTATWFTRNAVGLLVVTVVALRVGWSVRTRRRQGTSLAAWRPRPRQVLETLTLLAASQLVVLLSFGAGHGLPLAFVPVTVCVWAALRLPTTSAVLHDLLLNATVVVLTVSGVGVFAQIPDVSTRALVVQVFVGLVTVFGLTLAVHRDARDALSAEVAAQAGQALRAAGRTQQIARLGQDILTADDARAAVCRAAVEVAGADSCYLLQPDGQGGLISTGCSRDDLPPVQVRLDEASLTVRAFTSGDFQFVADVAGHAAAAARYVQATSVVSAAWKPVRDARDEVVGVLALVWTSHRDEVDEDVRATLSTLGVEASRAIERADLMARLAEAADQDQLTGLPNRRAWDRAAAAETSRASRSGEPLTFMIADLDHFKRYNDTLGHLEGDRLLSELALSARTCLRDTDVMARWGGEEFAFALPACTAAEATVVARRVLAAVPRGQTCTLGIARWHPGEAVEAVLERADQALYLGKQGGRATVVVHHDDLDDGRHDGRTGSRRAGPDRTGLPAPRPDGTAAPA